MKYSDYFKELENLSSLTLEKKGWFVIRLDGKAFHSFTSKLKKPFDSQLTNELINATKNVCQEIQNVKFAYLQSDEISLFLNDEDQLETNLFFNGKTQKIVSVVSSIFTAHFNRVYKHPDGKLGYFDARIFKAKKKEDIQDYLIWRQEDCFKNAVTLISLNHYSPKQIHEKNTDQKIEMIKQKGDNLENYLARNIYGTIIKKEKKRVLSLNKKTKIREYSDRSFWIEEDSFDFHKNSFESIIYND